MSEIVKEGNTVRKERHEAKQKETKTKTIEYTVNGNRLYRFRIVSRKELEKLRVPSYSYLL
jgi:hypothetical protein